MTTPALNHTKNRSTMRSPVPDRGNGNARCQSGTTFTAIDAYLGHRPSACGRSVYAQVRWPWRRRGAVDIEMTDGQQRPAADAGGCARRDPGGVDGCRICRSRGDRPRRIRGGVSLQPARSGPHHRGEGSDCGSRARQPGAVRARTGGDGQVVRASAHRQHLPGRDHRHRAALHRDAVPPARFVGGEDPRQRAGRLGGRATHRREARGRVGNRPPTTGSSRTSTTRASSIPAR